MGSVDGHGYPVLRFNYFDYAGEAIDGGHEADENADEQGTTTKELAEKVNIADAVFGIIDGRRVAEYFKGEERGQNYLRHRISSIVDDMIDAKCPIYFVVTQWDMLAPDEADDKERLAEVRNALLLQDSISNLVEQCRERKQIVRLIPVSAVGRKFAYVDPDDPERRTKKRKDGVLNALNVEFPLCAVVPDLFAQVEATLNDETKAEITKELNRRRSLRRPRQAAVALTRFLRRPAGRALRSAFGGVLGMAVFTEHLADMFLDWLAQREQVRRNLRVEGPQGRARHAVIQEFSEQMTVLKHKYPKSDLTKLVR
jgi:hypothetical protein